MFWLTYGPALIYVAIFGALIETKVAPEIVMNTMALLCWPIGGFSLIVQINRWHDRNKSGWWVLINLIPYLGWAYMIFECGFLKGTEGRNDFGNDPFQQRR